MDMPNARMMMSGPVAKSGQPKTARIARFAWVYYGTPSR